MKKLTLVLLGAVLALSLAACGADSDSVGTSTTTHITDTPTSITAEVSEQSTTTTEEGSVENTTTTNGIVLLPSDVPVYSGDGTTDGTTLGTTTTMDTTAAPTESTDTATETTGTESTKTSTTTNKPTSTSKTTVKTSNSTTKKTTVTTTTQKTTTTTKKPTTTTTTTTKKPTTTTKSTTKATTTKTTTTTKKPTTTTTKKPTTTTTTTTTTTRPTIPADPSLWEFTEEELRFIELVNEARKAEGLPALKPNGQLRQAAVIRVKETTQKYEHHRPNGNPFWSVFDELGIKWSSCAENLVTCNRDDETIERLHQALMNSSGHRQNILSTKRTDIAIAICRVNGNIYVVQLFMKPF